MRFLYIFKRIFRCKVCFVKNFIYFYKRRKVVNSQNVIKLKLTTKTNLVLYSILLIVTPFLMLQNYLQDAIGKLSRLSFTIGEFNCPFILSVAVLLAIPGIFYLVKNYSHKRISGIAIVLILLIIAYNTSDYYFNHHFYDIQHNWHYIAYGLFSWLAWRHFSTKQLNTGKVILRIFLMALTMSLSDELIQVFISDRVFDLSDVAKDLWGCLTGLVFINFVVFEFKYINFKNFWPQSKKHFSNFPAWILSLEFIFAIIFLNVSSVLSDAVYVKQVIFLTLAFFAFFFLIFKLLSVKTGRRIVTGAATLVIILLTITLIFSESKVKSGSENLFYYKRIPIAYFDVMIYPNGMIRAVDKKTHFNSRDQQKINSIGPDILILATGSKNQGGKGYHDQKKVEIRYNPVQNKVYQIIKLPNKEAFKLYNRLIKENKKILMIVHNS